MISKLQKALWILSSAAPMLVVFAVAWYLGKSTYITSIVSLISSFLLIVIAAFIFWGMKTKLATLEVQAKKVIQNDRYIGYTISCLLPFASIAFDKYDPYLFLGVSIIVFICMLMANTPTANPLLFFLGYHFYDVETENGIGNYLVISKRPIRNKDELKKVIRVTEYLLIDVSGER
jgi:hypothetical protein